MNEAEERTIEREVEDILRGPRDRRRRRLKRAGLIGGAAALALFLGFGGPWLIRMADKSDSACSNRDYEDTPGASTDCAWRARAWLFPAKLIPWTRERALAQERDVLYDQADRALRNTAEVTPNRAARDAAATRLIEAAKGGPITVERASDGSSYTYDPSTNVIAVLNGHGAHGAAGRAHVFSQDGQALSWALEGAVAVGDIDTAKAIAERDAPPSWNGDVERGALLCLLGEQKAGLARLDLADADYAAKIHSDGHGEANLARVLCGKPAPAKGIVQRGAILAAKLLTPEGASLPIEDVPQIDLLGFRGRDSFDIQDVRTPFVAAWLTRRERSLNEVIDVVAPIEVSLAPPLSPYTVGVPEMRGFLSSTPVPIDPAVEEQAAERLEALLARGVGSATSRSPAPAAMGSKGAPTMDAPRPLDDYFTSVGAIRAGRAAPERTLAQAAWVFWIEAACIRAALGDADRAKADLARAKQLSNTDDQRLFSAAILMHFGESRLAQGELDGISDANPTLATLANIDRALIALHDGKWEDAHALAKKAQDQAPDRLREATSWLLAATAIGVGRPAEGPGIATPNGYERDPTTWEKLADMPEPARKDLRLRMFGFDPPTTRALVLPAVFYVVGAAASGTDPEAWLDSFMPTAYPDLYSPVALRARAEAAHWRGDDTTARELDDIANKRLRLADTPAKLVLAKLARVR